MVTHTKEPGDNFLAPHLCSVVERSKVQIVPLVDHPVQAGNINVEEEQHEQNLLAKRMDSKLKVAAWLVFCVHREN
jgi:hypothetical protein